MPSLTPLLHRRCCHRCSLLTSHRHDHRHCSLLDQLSQMEINNMGRCEHLPTSKTAIESMPTLEIKQSNVFQAEAGDGLPKPGKKLFGNLPFPYMNGFLHLGHAFSLSKLEFAAAYHQLIGANVLLPLAFHYTGMPIKASANKVAREIQQFGDPLVFPGSAEADELEVPALEGAQETNALTARYRNSRTHTSG